MGRTKEEKLADYVRQGEVPKVKALLRKHRRLDVNKSADHKQHTLLHLVCANGDDAIARLLLKYGADPALQDINGDTALHVALQKVLHGYRHAFNDLVIPILKHSSRGSLDLVNKKGRTPRQLLEEADHKLEQQEEAELEQQKQSATSENEEAAWQDRLFQEWQDDCGADDEYFPFWQGYKSYKSQDSEYYDSWADRMRNEHRQKHSTASTQSHKHKREKEGRKTRQKSTEDAKDTFAWERAHQYKSERIQHKLIRQKENYLQRCQDVFNTSTDSTLNFDDIPWPKNSNKLESMIEILLCDINKSDVQGFKKFLRTQQLIWHPDKFLQKFGQRLALEDRERILKRVTELSQALNRISAKEETK